MSCNLTFDESYNSRASCFDKQGKQKFYCFTSNSNFLWLVVSSKGLDVIDDRININ